MEKPLKYATKTWEMRAQEVEKKKFAEGYRKQLAELVVISTNDFSRSTVALHYAKIAIAASGYFQFNYMQTKHLDFTEHYLYLAVKARLISDMLLDENSNTSKRSIQPIGEFIHYAIIGGYFDEAVSLIKYLLNRLIYEESKERQLWIKQECNLFLQLLANNYAKASLCIANMEQQFNLKDKTPVFNALVSNNNDIFQQSLKKYIRNSRITLSTPDTFNTFVLCIEKLAQKNEMPLCIDVAEAPIALLNLPSFKLSEFENKTGMVLPALDIDYILSTVKG